VISPQTCLDKHEKDSDLALEAELIAKQRPILEQWKETEGRMQGWPLKRQVWRKHTGEVTAVRAGAGGRGTHQMCIQY
jgi:hypothetical protein